MLHLSLGEGDPVGEELTFKVNDPFRLRNHMWRHCYIKVGVSCIQWKLR